MRPRRSARLRPPLNRQQLQELALAYVGRFSTTRAKLRDYLARKVRERGWDDGAAPDLEAVAARCADLGYVDDRAYALSKSRTLNARGFGQRRVDQSLRQAGVAEEDGAEARRLAGAQAVDAALRFAQRRRFGPYSTERTADPRDRERALAAMIRAGHPFGLARAIINLAPGMEPDRDELSAAFDEPSE